MLFCSSWFAKWHMKTLANSGASGEPISSMLRHGLRLICMKSYNGHNFVKIYQNLPKFGSLGKFSCNVRNQIYVSRDHFWSSPRKKRKLKMGWRDAIQYILQRLPLTRALKGFFCLFKLEFSWTSINCFHGFPRALKEKVLLSLNEGRIISNDDGFLNYFIKMKDYIVKTTRSLRAE